MIQVKIFKKEPSRIEGEINDWLKMVQSKDPNSNYYGRRFTIIDSKMTGVTDVTATVMIIYNIEESSIRQKASMVSVREVFSGDRLTNN